MTGQKIDAIDHCLPQTQCTRCSYPSCRDYAIAIHDNTANINQCPPGGEVTIAKLATLTGRPKQPLDPQYGEYLPKRLAIIDEERCIGCVLCIKACPVDAIVGANKLMHTVIQAYCTGCELCLPVCPTDCIEMQPRTTIAGPQSDWPGYTPQEITLARRHYWRRKRRLESRTNAEKKASPAPDSDTRRQAILAAVKRKQQVRKS